MKSGDEDSINLSDNRVVITVDTMLKQSLLEESKASFLQWLRDILGLHDITLSINFDETLVPKKPHTKQEIFTIMSHSSPNLLILRDLLDLSFG